MFYETTVRHVRGRNNVTRYDIFTRLRVRRVKDRCEKSIGNDILTAIFLVWFFYVERFVYSKVASREN